MEKKLLTEQDILDAAKRGIKTIGIEESTIVTPAARDSARWHKIDLSVGSPLASASTGVDSVTVHNPSVMKSSQPPTTIALGADHGGFQMKEAVRKFLLELGYSVADVGTHSEQTCDYPDYAYAVASLVSSGQASRGIMIDGVGVASAIVANKVPGIRAVPCYDEFVAKSSREHNDANVLTLGGRVVGIEAAKSIIKAWLETWFGGGRHQARIQKISDIERLFTSSDGVKKE